MCAAPLRQVCRQGVSSGTPSDISNFESRQQPRMYWRRKPQVSQSTTTTQTHRPFTIKHGNTGLYYPATAWAVSVPTTAWGGGSDPTPPLLSQKRMDVERRTRRHSKDLDETLPNHFRKFKIEVTCQVKVRSKVKIGCFQVADRSDLKRSMFRPKLSICTPKDQAKVLTSEIISYLAQVKVKVRSEKVTKSKIFKCVV